MLKYDVSGPIGEITLYEKNNAQIAHQIMCYFIYIVYSNIIRSFKKSFKPGISWQFLCLIKQMCTFENTWSFSKDMHTFRVVMDMF